VSLGQPFGDAAAAQQQPEQHRELFNRLRRNPHFTHEKKKLFNRLRRNPHFTHWYEGSTAT